MSTTIYDSPEPFEPTLPDQGGFAIDITSTTVWFFEHRVDGLQTATVPLAQLDAIYHAIGDYLGYVRPTPTEAKDE